MAKFSNAARVVAFIEEYCKISEGKDLGKPLKLEKFQKRFIKAVFDNPKKTRRAYLSIARKNGKTALIAAICLAFIVGPMSVKNSQVVSGAMSRDQAGIVFRYMVGIINMDDRLKGLVKIIPSQKRIIGLPMNVEYRALAADGKTAHGLSPLVAILDEIGQVEGPYSDFISAITTSQGAYENPILFGISTQAKRDNDLFSIWIDDAIKHPDSQIVCHLYAAPADCALDDKKAWAVANPGLGIFRSLDDVIEQSANAMRMPTQEADFRNLTLNQRVETSSPFVTQKVWKENGHPALPLEKRKVFGGLDLSSVADLTAMVLIAADRDFVDVHSSFWLPKEGIAEKSAADRVPYDVWATDGKLMLTPGRSIEYEHVAEILRGVFDKYEVEAIAFDRWNMRYLMPWLQKVGFSDSELEKFKEFGQGFASMSPAIRSLESLLLQNRLRHGNHPVLSMCAANATIKSDDAGNRKFIKAKEKGRIDGMVALAMAVGAAGEHLQAGQEVSFWDQA